MNVNLPLHRSSGGRRHIAAEERVGGQEAVSISINDSLDNPIAKGRKEMRLWFEGVIKRRTASGGGGAKWNLSIFEYREEDADKEREGEDARDTHLE